MTLRVEKSMSVVQIKLLSAVVAPGEENLGAIELLVRAAWTNTAQL